MSVPVNAREACCICTLSNRSVNKQIRCMRQCVWLLLVRHVIVAPLRQLTQSTSIQTFPVCTMLFVAEMAMCSSTWHQAPSEWSCTIGWQFSQVIYDPSGSCVPAYRLPSSTSLNAAAWSIMESCCSIACISKHTHLVRATYSSLSLHDCMGCEHIP